MAMFKIVIIATMLMAANVFAEPHEELIVEGGAEAKTETRPRVKPEKWAVYYGSDLPAEEFVKYDVIAFDAKAHPPLRLLRNRGKTLLGYISLGEAEDYRADFKRLKKMGVLLKENPHWKGHYVVDIRKPAWAKYIIEEKIPEVLFQRFDGIMFDTLDSPLALMNDKSGKYTGMKEAAIRLLKAVRMHYPNIKIMVNRGYDAFPEIAPYMDMSLAESTLVNHMPDDALYEYFNEDVQEYYRVKIQQGLKSNARLKVYSLDYWKLDDVANVKKIYEKQRRNGYVPYVSTIDLQAVHAEPK